MRARLTALVVAIAGCGSAQPAETTTATSEAPPETLTADQVLSFEAAAPPPVAPGGEGEIVTTIRVAATYHVMSDRPSKPNYIATRVTASAEGVELGEPSYPPAIPFQLWDETIETFEGTFEVRVPFRVPPDAAAGDRVARLTIEYQACTTGSCLFPANKEASVPIVVTSR